MAFDNGQVDSCKPLMVADTAPAYAREAVNAYGTNVVENACPAEDLCCRNSVLCCAKSLIETVPCFEDCGWNSML